MYKNGEGVPQDYAEAIHWYLKAAEQGDVNAQFNLGLMHDEGQGVAQNYIEASRWYQKAANQGDVNAQFNLGTMYDQGQGVPQDSAEAIRWYRKAAEQGDDYANLNLGLMYIAGQGVAQDYAEALRWFEKGAEGGSVECANSLAWVLATCPDDKIRDGDRAIVIAKEVVEKEVSPRTLDTLAAAYAAAGRFEDAIYTQEQAIVELQKEAANDYLEKGYLDRLQTYQSGKSWLKP